MDIRRDIDPTETQEWLDSVKSVVAARGPERASYLVGRVVEQARHDGAPIPHSLNTPYINTIPPEKQERSPGIYEIEHKIRSVIRWNAVMLILRANKESSELGGHIASFQSAAVMYDIGSVTSGTRLRKITATILFIRRGIPCPASTRALLSKAGFRKTK